MKNPDKDYEEVEYAGFRYTLDGNGRAVPVPGQHPAAGKEKHIQAASQAGEVGGGKLDKAYEESLALDEAYAQADAFDIRYEHVRCTTCGQNWQRIDWRCAAHTFFCTNPVEGPLDQETIDAAYEQSPDFFNRIAGDR